jgi:colanic acid/amylovoran biosynthesis glycosyltransferase
MTAVSRGARSGSRPRAKSQLQALAQLMSRRHTFVDLDGLPACGQPCNNPETDSKSEIPISMKIAYLLSQYPAVNHTYLLREIRQLRECGFDVRVASIRACDRSPDRLTEIEREEAARTFYVKPAGVASILRAHLTSMLRRPIAYFRTLGYTLALAGPDLRKLIRYAFFFAEAVVFGEWMRREQLPHAHTHFASLVAMISARLYPITFSMTLHGPDEFLDPVGFHLCQKVAASQFVCAISQYGRSQVLKNCDFEEWSKVEVIYLGADPGMFAPPPFALQPSTFDLICVGSLLPAKAQHMLLAAVADLLKQGRPVRLRLVGDGPDRSRLERYVEQQGLRDAVHFEGAVNQDRILDLYREADIFVLASFAEGIPVVLMEAMAMQIPCVATWIAGIPELIRNEVDGLLVPASDLEALTRAIARLLDDSELRRRLGEDGRRRVCERFNLGANARQLGQTFRDRLQSPNVRHPDYALPACAAIATKR